MFYGQKVEETRQMFYQSWSKFRQNLPMQPLEAQIAAVITEHPEYHKLFEASDEATQNAYFAELGEANPFMHLGLHLAIRDQVRLNRPLGIQAVFQQLSQKLQSAENAEHLLMEQLAMQLYQSQRSAQMPSETEYLQACRQLLL